MPMLEIERAAKVQAQNRAAIAKAYYENAPRRRKYPQDIIFNHLDWEHRQDFGMGTIRCKWFALSIQEYIKQRTGKEGVDIEDLKKPRTTVKKVDDFVNNLVKYGQTNEDESIACWLNDASSG